jgi:hypothetical protein
LEEWQETLVRELVLCDCVRVYIEDFTHAFCFLEGIASEIPPSPETLVGWLLEHPDHAVCNSDTASSFDGLSDTDSVSEDVEDMTVSHTEGVSGRHDGVPHRRGYLMLNANFITSSYHGHEPGSLKYYKICAITTFLSQRR